MCDTILAQPNNTAEHVMLFGKNSDRQRNEAQAVEHRPRADYEPDDQVTCTYITIPQKQRTYAILLCRPFWMWGCEMGANEHGVVVGNEGIHARIPAQQEESLTGMDLVRLALERAATAAEAVDVITTLLERYGQGGNCGHLSPSYHNSGFVITDPAESFVLETVGREWILERISNVRALSNTYSIGQNAESVSRGLCSIIGSFGSKDDRPNYAGLVANPDREFINFARARQARSTSLLRSRDGGLRAADMMAILRDHSSDNKICDNWHPGQSETLTLCMHAGGEERYAQTVGSLVSEIHTAVAVHWVTGTSAPCISIFKPLFIDVALPELGPPVTDRFDPETLWWRHEQLHRSSLCADFPRFLRDIREERDALETSFQARVNAVQNVGSVAERKEVVDKCWLEAKAMEDRWFARLATAKQVDDRPYYTAWQRMNRIAGMT